MNWSRIKSLRARALPSSQKALEEESEFVRAIFDSLNAHMAVLDPNGIILNVNEAWRRFAGENGADEATRHSVGLSYFSHCVLEPGENRVESADVDDASAGIRKVQAGLLQSFRMEYPCHSESERRWFTMCVLPVAGHPGTVIVAHEDITEARRLSEERIHLELQLAEARRLESLGALAGGVAHDMNNVLAAILVIATSTLENQAEDSPLCRPLTTITRAATRGGQMVKTLLQFARHDPVERLEENVDLTIVIREVVQLLNWTTLAKVHLNLDLAENLPAIRGNEGALVHALMNLCVNAVDAMPEDGALTLRTRKDDPDWIEVEVEDNGIGMTREVLKKAMDSFFTTKEAGKGTGLGLSMVHSTMKAHQGKMEIHSEPGQGTRVVMYFPKSAFGRP